MTHIKFISVNDADTILARDPHAILLDIRHERDFNAGHHPKAQHLTEKRLRTLLKTTPKSVAIIIYCYHGISSQDIARLFSDFGFKECYSVDGGYESWRKQVNSEFSLASKGQRWLMRHNVHNGDINARLDAEFRTPLMLAAKAGLSEVVYDLIEAGADPNLKDIQGNNAVWYACIGQSEPCIRLLINADAEVDNQNRYGFTALNYAVGMDNIFNLLAVYFEDDSLLRLSHVPINDFAYQRISEQPLTSQAS